MQRHLSERPEHQRSSIFRLELGELRSLHHPLDEQGDSGRHMLMPLTEAYVPEQRTEFAGKAIARRRL
jgi:hypothetical protein